MDTTLIRTPKKNEYVDALKGIACIIVIFLHCRLPGIIGDGIIYGLRFSVPIFFMVSGYYSYFKKDEWIIAKAKYILKLLIFTELFYGVWTFVSKCLIQNDTFHEIFESIVGNKNIVQVIFCGTLFNGTLWYLYAMFWTWIIIYGLRKVKLLKKAYVLIPILLCVQIFGRAYVQNVYDIEKYVFLFRNALTFGVPFSLLGTWLAENEANIVKKIDIRKNVLIIGVGFLLIVVEFFAFGQYMDTHVSSVLIATGMFLFAVRQQGEIKKYLKGVAYVGSRWYVWIYLSHMFVSGLVELIFKGLWIDGDIIFQYVLPILVCILSCVCSEIIVRIKWLDKRA